MAWNQSGNNSDPWGNRSNKNNFDLNKKLTGFFDRFQSNGGSPNFYFFLLIAFLVSVLWFFSGFYTIKEAERGVLLRFGKHMDNVDPGLHWKFSLVDSVFPVDVRRTRVQSTKGNMLTQDENVVVIEMEVQYRISDPYKYLFSATDANKSLKEATDSALRYVVGHNKMDSILTVGREAIRQDTFSELLRIIQPYDIGLDVVDVNMLPARPPENVQQAYDDAISAQEDEERYIKSAIVYQKAQEPKAVGIAQRIREDALAYKQEVILKAKGESFKFDMLLPEYTRYPELTKQRLYLDTMTSVFSNSTKILVESNSGSMFYMPLDKVLQANTRGVKKEDASINKDNLVNIDDQGDQVSLANSIKKFNSYRKNGGSR